MATEALAEGEGRLSEDLSEERGTGLKKKNKIYKMIHFVNYKTVYIGKQEYDNKKVSKLSYFPLIILYMLIKRNLEELSLT